MGRGRDCALWLVSHSVSNSLGNIEDGGEDSDMAFSRGEEASEDRGEDIGEFANAIYYTSQG